MAQHGYDSSAHYKRIADALQLENDANVKAIENLEGLLAKEMALREAAEAALDARLRLGFNLELPSRLARNEDYHTDGRRRSITPERTHFPRGSSGNGGAPRRLSDGSSSAGAYGAAYHNHHDVGDSHGAVSRVIPLIKVAPQWVYKPHSREPTHGETAAVIRGLRDQIALLEAENKAAKVEKIKMHRDYELKMQDLQRKLNKREKELSELRDQYGCAFSRTSTSLSVSQHSSMPRRSGTVNSNHD